MAPPAHARVPRRGTGRGALLWVAVAISLPLVGSLAPLALAASSTPALCSAMEHRLSSSTTYRVIDEALLDEGGPFASPSCPGGTTGLQQGECRTLRTQAVRPLVGAPPAPDRVYVYVFHADRSLDHGSLGRENWTSRVVGYSFLSFDDFSANQIEFCATTDGTSAGTPDVGPWRFVIRACRNGANIECAIASPDYDINNDANPECQCQGNPGAGTTVLNALHGLAQVPQVEERDPVHVTGPSTATVGQQVHLSVKARHDNLTSRMGAASNITVLVQRPDGTLAYDGNPTEKTWPSNTGGRVLLGDYGVTFTPNMAGTWNATAYVITSRNELRSSLTLSINVTTSPPATQADVADLRNLIAQVLGAAQYGTNQALNASGVRVSDKTGYALASSERDAIATGTWNAANRSLTDRTLFQLADVERVEVQRHVWNATQRTLSGSVDPTSADIAAAVWDALWTDHRDDDSYGRLLKDSADATTAARSDMRGWANDSANSHDALARRIDQEGATTRSYLPVHYAASAWARLQPTAPIASVAFYGGLTLTGLAVLQRDDTRRRLALFLCGLMVLGAYAWGTH